MHMSDHTVHLSAYAELPDEVDVRCSIQDDRVEITLGEHSHVLGIFDGLSLLVGERGLQRVIAELTTGLAELRATRG
jgi:hypothetical protein